MGTRGRLQNNIESSSRRKQMEYEYHTGWVDKQDYYKKWDKVNVKYGEWTSDDYYQTKLTAYQEELKKKQKEIDLKNRRDKLRKLFLEEEKEFGMELLESPREKKYPTKKSHSIEELKEINIGLKLAEEDRRKHEAEIQLYNQWRNNNPVLREFETNQSRASLKLAWLDQQVEKRMAQEKQEQEVRRMLEDRERLLKEEEELERIEKDHEQKREKILQEQIEENRKAFKKNEEKMEAILLDQSLARQKQNIYEEILEKHQRDLEMRRNKELELYNINQSKLKLRKRALEIQEQLRNERLLIEDINRLKLAETIINEEEKNKAKEDIKNYLRYVEEQKKLEQQRQNYISFIFDSEAKLMWQKQERIWRSEQDTRDRLLNNVLHGLREQIQERMEQNRREELKIRAENEEVLRNIDEVNKQIKLEKELLERKKKERRMELDKQINDKRLSDMEKDLQEQERKRQEIEAVKKEEERLRNELMQMQRSKYHPARYNHKRSILW